MNPSNRITARSSNLIHYTNSNLAEQQYWCKHTIGERTIKIHFNQLGDKICDLAFSGDLGDLWDTIFDLYLDLIEGKSFDEMRKIGNKELDYYVRDNPAQRVFDYYPDEFLKVIQTPISIQKRIQDELNIRPFYATQEYGDFLSLPLGMKLELLEDFFSEYKKFKCEIIDIEEDTLSIKAPKDSSSQILLQDLNFNFQTEFKINLQ